MSVSRLAAAAGAQLRVARAATATTSASLRTLSTSASSTPLSRTQQRVQPQQLRQPRRPLSPAAAARRSYATAAMSSPPPAGADAAAAGAAPLVSLTEADLTRLARQRNIGIAAHVDSGKTTLTERVLFYTGRISAIHEVRGRDAVGAKMDHMELEREKGITIQSAATFCKWKATPPTETRTVSGDAAQADTSDAAATKEDFHFNIIDTPGHVDFTIEVERALRVLDGAVLVLCATSGVQSQSITVDRQMRRYSVPRISFINKMDRAGANPWRVIQQIRTKLRMNAAAVQIPIGAEDAFAGIVDLVRWKTVWNEGEKGISVREEDGVPKDLEEFAREKRQELIEQLSEVDEPMADIFLEEREPTLDELAASIRRATLSTRFSPVYMGSAIKNKGVQALLDGVCAYLPNPAEVPAIAIDTSAKAQKASAEAAAQGARAAITAEASSGGAAAPSEEELEAAAQEAAKKAPPPQLPLAPASAAPFVGLAFKLEEGRFGQLTYVRVYQGTLKKGTVIFNARTGKKVKVPRLVRMHSNDMEDVDELGAGEICAMFGVECSSGDTFTDGTTTLSMSSMFVPEPVISLSITPEGAAGGASSSGGAPAAPAGGKAGGVSPNFSRALNRFQKEDPTFRVHIDPESGETIISGMGELHLEIYVERMRREYNVPCRTGRPRVAFRETITSKVPFSYTHKKQTGGAGQFARVAGYIEPMEVGGAESSASFGEEGAEGAGEDAKSKNKPKDVAFENRVVGGSIPHGYFPACEKGFYDALERGLLTGHSVTGVRLVLEDGMHHAVDSSELAFRLAVVGAFREAFRKANPIVMEPKMTVEVVAPVEFQGAVVGGVNQRKGTIEDTEVREDEFTLQAEVSLNDMFGYSSQLRGQTQGKGEFSMEYKMHAPVMPNVQKEMEEAYRKKQLEKNK